MDVETRLELATSLPVQEIVQVGELRALFQANSHPTHYIGFEASGLFHLGSLLCAQVINKLDEAGVKTQVFLADWHSLMNHKLGEDWDRIQRATKYFEEGFSFLCPNTRIVRGSDLYHHNDDYWMNVVKFNSHVTLARATRCLAIMGRTQNDKLDVSQYLYPSMQALDIHELKADIAHAGMDQRKVHMLARDVYPKMGWRPPIALHHHLISGLSEPVKNAGFDEDSKLDEVIASKMSKSKPGTAIFIHDSGLELREKLGKAYCPMQVEGNPVLEIARLIVFPRLGILSVERPEKYGGVIEFGTYADLEKAFLEKRLHAMDLKNGVASALNDVIAPLRQHFERKAELMKVFDSVE